MTRIDLEPLAPEMGERAAPAACDSCGRALHRGPVSRVFPTWHARCLERAVWEARAEARQD